MNPEIKQKWLEALRSGKYQQGQGKLRRRCSGVDQYCCLGVLCDVMGAQWEFSARDIEGNGVYSTANAIGYPSYKVRAKAGISSDVEQALVGMNDGRGASFAKIADWIEENL